MRLPAVVLTVVSALASPWPSSAAAPRVAPAVAVVLTVEGSATVNSRGLAARRAHRFDWLPERTILETSAASRLVLVFATGERFEVGERTRAVVTRSGTRALAGEVRRLAALPPLPKTVAFPPDDTPGA